MSILIENAATQEFLTTTGTWTKDVARGRSFANSHAAFAVAAKEVVPNFNIVLYLPGNLQTVNLDFGKGLTKAAPAV